MERVGTEHKTNITPNYTQLNTFENTREPTALTVLMQTSPASLSQRYGADRVLAVTGEQVQAYS